MSRNVRLFPTFSQRENQTTNHCLLILKMLYEENPKFLSEALDLLLDEALSDAIGVKFTQQKRGQNCVPDGEIMQEPFSILIETKRGNHFNREQLLNHLKTLNQRQGKKILIALGNFEFEGNSCDPILAEVEQQAKADGVFFTCVSFERFLQSIRLNYLPKNLVDAIDDLDDYFDEEDLLPTWKRRLDVVNCKRTFDQVLQHRVYICPANGGHYSHRRSSYFGTYRNKRVEQVALIEAVIDLESQTEATLKWKNVDCSNESLIAIAQERHRCCADWFPARIFVLGELHPTDFEKTSPGGMQGNKQYFDISKLKVKNAAELALTLKGKKWDNYNFLFEFH